MELADGTTDIVHPEVRAHISSLVAALGGASTEDDGRYHLGDDALEVLRDIKRWIRFYDEKTNRMDVARCIHEANLIEGDLLPILATWPENATDIKYKSRIALACFEIMVPLTWPMERDKERMTINHHRHMPVLELAQVQYKMAIINFDEARILHAAVRTALPSLALPASDRAARDQGIIKLVLFFLRNMAMIAPPPNVQYEGDETQISRSATIDAFSYQDIFLFLLTLASNMGDDFRTEDTSVMEIIYHLIKRVDIEKLFMTEQQVHKAKAHELTSLMNKESAMLKAYTRNGPTRHNRFGTMIWVKREDGKMSSLSGQDALADTTARNLKMDKNKVFKPPRRTKKENKDERDLGPPAKLNARATGQLRSFVEEFLDSGFNPLFQHVRKTIDREASHVMQYHRRQFFYLVAWFLEAERTRQKLKRDSKKNNDDVSSFSLVAGVLNQEMFITLNKAMHEAYEYKDWHELAAVMRCFTQILLTVQAMTESGREDDEEIAENVLSRLFYEESTHDTIANIIRTYKDQGFYYLDAATELVHHFLRILEAYSKQNADMQVRSRKRTRQKKNKDQQQGTEDGVLAEENDDSANDDEAAERTSKERKFDFQRFAARFTPQGVVNTFVKFTRFYQDMDDSQLKRVHRFFYRLAFKQEMSVMLFRVDIIHLLYNMIKGPEPLDKGSGMYKDWEELVKQILRKCFKKIEQRPELIIEMLFSKLQSTAFFLEYGYEKQTTSKKQAKPGGELVFKYTEERDRQIAIVVGALLDKNEGDHISWVKSILTAAESERRSWAAAEEALPSTETPMEESADASEPKESSKPPPFNVRPDSDARRAARFKNSYLRLLLNLCGIRLFGPADEETPESLWILPEDVTADSLKDTLHYINQAEFSPPTFDDGQLAENQLKRKLPPRKKADFDDDEDDDMDDEILFEPGGPTVRKVIDESERPKKTKKRRRRNSQALELDDEELEEKARKRREREREKARKIKSAVYVREGDDEFDEEEDEEFFAREREIAARAAKAAQSAAEPVIAKKPTKRKSAVQLDSDDEGGEDNDDDLLLGGLVDDEEAENSRDDDTPAEESDGESRKKRKVSVEEDGVDAEGDDVDMEDASQTQQLEANAAEEGDDAPVVVARRPRIRGGFVIDSDDDE
ncbi:Topoisomerase 1-associated factor 1 [Trichoderma asperellum]|uniref:Topoisomerase 1-associated factor 1 n=1 Tax=Trichoderma asperellum TaxID=101201 RepID=UPI00332FC535|nr:Topoisomerase 1-associated factor 1 [Trichoderma asperellum]